VRPSRTAPAVVRTLRITGCLSPPFPVLQSKRLQPHRNPAFRVACRNSPSLFSMGWSWPWCWCVVHTTSPDSIRKQRSVFCTARKESNAGVLNSQAFEWIRLPHFAPRESEPRYSNLVRECDNTGDFLEQRIATRPTRPAQHRIIDISQSFPSRIQLNKNKHPPCVCCLRFFKFVSSSLVAPGPHHTPCSQPFWRQCVQFF